MVDRVVPVIPPEHYPAFQGLAPGLPDTFSLWNARHLGEIRDAIRRGERLIAMTPAVAQPRGQAGYNFEFVKTELAKSVLTFRCPADAELLA
jgi:hypothetical protein